jgi:hypothetical protein
MFEDRFIVKSVHRMSRIDAMNRFTFRVRDFAQGPSGRFRRDGAKNNKGRPPGTGLLR